jgi:hypothetical protein
MYIASYQGTDGRSLYQVLVHFPRLVLEGGERTWTVAYRAFIESLLDSDVDFTYRVGCYAGSFHRYLFITASRRNIVAELAEATDRLNRIVDASVVRPANQAEHDREASRFPPIRRSVCCQQLFAGKFEIPCDFYAYPIAPRLLRQALTSQTDFALQIDCRRRPISQEELRTVRKRLADLRLSGWASGQLIAHVSKHVEELADRTYLVDESIAAGSNHLLNTAESMIQTAFNQLYRPLGFSGSPLGDPPPDDEIILGMHNSYFDESVAAQRIWRRATPTALRDSLGWIPDQTFASLGATNSIKSSLSQSELLIQIARRLDDIGQRTAKHPGTGFAASLRGSLKISEMDLLAGAATARGVVEEIVRTVFAEVCPTEVKKTTILDRMIERLQEVGAVPAPVYSSMHTVRTVGNIGAHRKTILSHGDLETCMIAALRVTEWFLLERDLQAKPHH